MKPQAPENTIFRSISAWQGRIRRLLICLPQCQNGIEDIGRYFNGLFDAMRDCDTEFIVIGLSAPGDICQFSKAERNTRMQRVERKLGMKGNILPVAMFMQSPELCELEVWVQDVFLITIDSRTGKTCILDGIRDDVVWDNRINEQVAELVGARCDYPVIPVRYNIVGGDLLPGGDFVISGPSILASRFGKASSGARPSRSEATRFLQSSLGAKYVIWPDAILQEALASENPDRITKAFRHLGHVDRYLTLGGPMPENPYKHLLFVAEIREEYNALVGAPESVKDKAQNIGKCLDILADELTRLRVGEMSFEIQRLPLVVEARPGLTPEFRYFNNCLVEVYENVRNVYVPVFDNVISAAAQESYQRAEEAMQSAFSSRGFTVHKASGEFPSNLGGNGSLRCAVKVLERDEN